MTDSVSSSNNAPVATLNQRFESMSWKELIKNVDAGILQMLFYCESNQDWLKAIEANELLQNKLSSFASLLGKFAVGSLESPNQKTTGPMFGVGKAPPPLSMGVGTPNLDKHMHGSVLNRQQPASSTSVFPPQPPTEPISAPAYTPGDPQASHPPPGTLGRNQGSSRQSATRLRPDAPAFLPKKEESDFMRATEASMAKVRRVASNSNIIVKDGVRATNTDVRSSHEGRKSIGNSSNPTNNNVANQPPPVSGSGSVPTNAASAAPVGSNAASHTGPTVKTRQTPHSNNTSHHPNNHTRDSTGPFALPPPLVQDDKDEWEEKVKAEMQAATEQVWQAAEAWVDAEAEVEELEWRILEMGIGRYVGLIDAPIDVDDVGSGKIEVKSAKKEKLLLDTAFHNVDDSTYWAVRHTDKSPEKRSTRYSTPQKTDEYPSPQQLLNSGGSSSGTKLHSKLSSPDRKRSLTPTEALRKIEARLSAAEVNRDRSVHEKVQKAQLVSNRVKLRNEKEAERLHVAGEALHSKLRSASQRHSDYIAVIKGRAGNENAKVNDVLNAIALNSEMVSYQLQQKLEEVEAKILAANLRREQRLAVISGSQKRKNNKKALQMSEYRLQLEKVKMDRWEKLQRRIEAVQERRRVRIAEMTRRAEDEARKKEEENIFMAPSDSLDPIAEDGLLQQQLNELRRSGSNNLTGGHNSSSSAFSVAGGAAAGSSSLHNSPGRKSLLSDHHHHHHHHHHNSSSSNHVDDESELTSIGIADNDGLFIAPEWMEIPLEMYSDFKSASALAHKLLTESMTKAKIRQWRKDAYAKALSCLWAASGFYHHYYTADLVGCEEPLQAVIAHLLARRKCVGDGEEREASSFNMYSGLICEIGAPNALFERPEAIEKINFALASVVDQLQLSMQHSTTIATTTAASTTDNTGTNTTSHHTTVVAAGDSSTSISNSSSNVAVATTTTIMTSAAADTTAAGVSASTDGDDNDNNNSSSSNSSSPVSVPSPFQPVDDFVSSGGLLLLTVFFSYECGLLCAGGVDSAWLIDSKWFDSESKVFVGKTTAVDLQAILRLVRIAIERIESNILLACCALHHVLGEMALFLSLIIYRGRCENITFRASEHATTQKLQEILGEVLTLWALLIEKMIVLTTTTTQTKVTETLQLFSLVVPGRVGSSLSMGDAMHTGSPLIQQHTLTEEKSNNPTSSSEEDLTMQRQVEDILFSYFQYTFLCQDLANLFTSIHVAVLSVQLSMEEAFVVWKSETLSAQSTQQHTSNNNNNNNTTATATAAAAARLPIICNAAFLRLITGAAEYATALTVFIRWSKAHANPAYHTLAKHWWSLMRKANIMQFLYGGLVLTIKELFVSLYFCHETCLSVLDLEVLLQTSIALMKTTFAMMMVDGEVFKQLSQAHMSTLLFHFHVLLLLLTKFMDYGKEGVTDTLLQPSLCELTDEQLVASKLCVEVAFQQLLSLLTLISQADVDIRRSFGQRRYNQLEEVSKCEMYMRHMFSEPVAAATAAVTTNTTTTTATNSSNNNITSTNNNNNASNNMQNNMQSLFYALCHLSVRYYKASRTQHSVCTCIIAICMELEQHVLMVRQARRERYLQKFVEYMLREFDGTTTTTITTTSSTGGNALDSVMEDDMNTTNIPNNNSNSNNNISEEEQQQHKRARQVRWQRCVTLIPEEYWKTVIRLVWMKEQHHPSSSTSSSSVNAAADAH